MLFCACPLKDDLGKQLQPFCKGLLFLLLFCVVAAISQKEAGFTVHHVRQPLYMYFNFWHTAWPLQNHLPELFLSLLFPGF